MLHDLRYALRSIRGTPIASTVAILTIAIGVGANTAIFSVIRAVLLKPLPFADADRLVQISESWPNRPGPRPISRLNYADWIAQADVFEQTAAISWGSATVGAEHPFNVDGSLVSPSYFDVFGLHAALGRTFARDDDQPGRDHVVILSHRLWRSKFGGDPAIVGSPIRLDGEPYTVIGVMPMGLNLHFWDSPMWRPLVLPPPASRTWRDLQLVEAKLKPGVSVAHARAQMDAIADRLARQYPDADKGYGVVVEPFPHPVGLDVESSLYLLFGAVGMVLLIACVNLANLAIVRGAARSREVAIRAALGASRAQIVRQFLVEHLMIALTGGVAGIGVSALVLRLALPAIPTTGLRAVFPPDTAIAIDRGVWLFGIALSTLSGLAFGVLPAAGIARAPLVEAIREGTPTASIGRSQAGLRGVLVIAEVALAFVLLSGAALLIQSFSELVRRVDAGFDHRGMLTASLPMPAARFQTGDALNRYLDKIAAGIRQLPGVREVAFADATPPMAFPYGKLIHVVGEPEVPYASRHPIGFKVVSASYFSAAGLRLIDGRALSDDDREGAPPVLVINETMSRTLFSGTRPIGRQILLRRAPFTAAGTVSDQTWTIVGIVADEGISPFERTAQAGAYATRAQHPRPDLNLVVRTGVAPAALEEPIRKAVAAVDRDQAVGDLNAIEQLEAEDVANDRLRSMLLTAFAAVASTLTGLGIYGVVAFGVVQRTRELGIRAALGATAPNLLRVVLGQTLRMVALGLMTGAVAAAGALRVLQALLYGVRSTDPAIMAAVAVVLALVAVIACYVPARMAVSVDPLIAIRQD
jgi:predicted permease